MDSLSNLDLFTLLAVIVLGASGTYLLLPHSHGRTRPKLAHRIGYTLTALSVLAMMRFWRADVEVVTKVFFYIFASGSVLAAILTITSRDPIHSALWFAAVVLATSGLFLLSGAQFLAAGTVIVYGGAIIVTFLFVIMLAQKEGRAIYDRMARSPFLATLAGFLLLFTLLYSLIGVQRKSPTALAAGNRLIPASERLINRPDNPNPSEADLERHRSLSADHSRVFNRALPRDSRLPEAFGLPADGNHVASLGASLYTDYLIVVELAGALLFVALIGALAIATPRAPIRPTVPAIVSSAGSGVPVA